MDLVIDIGNTQSKLGVFVNSGIQSVERYVNDDPSLITKLKNLRADRCIVSSVRGWSTELARAIGNQTRFWYLDHNTPVPLRNTYETPETLGKDRLAAAVGAAFLYPKKNCLTIDAGTCITYDLVTADGRYLGGSISPGLGMRARALHEFTAELPLVEEYGEQPLIGRNTKEAISSGVLNGTVHELNGMTERYHDEFSDLQIIITGGDARYLVNQLKGKIFANQNLVLIGLHKILLYNAL